MKAAKQLCWLLATIAVTARDVLVAAHPFLKQPQDCRRVPSLSRRGASDVAKALRGGAGPLDPEATTRVVTALQGLQHGAVLLAPSKTLQSYGLQSKDDLVAFLFSRSSLSYGAVTAMAYLTILQGVETRKAVAYCCSLPWAIEILRSLLNGEGKTLGVKASRQIEVGLVSLAVTVVCLRGSARAADIALKVQSLFPGLTGVFALGANEMVRKMWGMGGGAETIFASRVLAYALLCMGVMVGSLAWGTTPKKSFAYAMVVCLANLIDNNFITNEVSKLGLQRTPQYIWMATNVAVIATLAF